MFLLTISDYDSDSQRNGWSKVEIESKEELWDVIDNIPDLGSPDDCATKDELVIPVMVNGETSAIAWQDSVDGNSFYAFKLQRINEEA